MKVKLKKIFNLYNLAITACIVVIGVSLVIIFEPNLDTLFSKNNVSSHGNVKVNVSEENAMDIAKQKFEELGETGVKTEEFEVLKIARQGEEYYYISSKENTVEIKIETGEITRVNSVKVK